MPTHALTDRFNSHNDPLVPNHLLNNSNDEQKSNNDNSSSKSKPTAKTAASNLDSEILSSIRFW
jgi:hypothetical protein